MQGRRWEVGGSRGCRGNKIAQTDTVRYRHGHRKIHRQSTTKCRLQTRTKTKRMVQHNRGHKKYQDKYSTDTDTEKYSTDTDTEKCTDVIYSTEPVHEKKMQHKHTLKHTNHPLHPLLHSRPSSRLSTRAKVPEEPRRTTPGVI